MIAADKPTITYGLRGLAYFDVFVWGPDHDLHSGLYGGTVHNPAQALIELIAGMHDENGSITLPGFYDPVRPVSAEEHADMAKLPQDEAFYLEQTGVPELWGEPDYLPVERVGARPTLEVNGFLSGYTGEGSKTVLPAKAMAKISCRLVPDQTPHEVHKQLLAYMEANAPKTIKWEVRLLNSGPTAIQTGTCRPSSPWPRRWKQSGVCSRYSSAKAVRSRWWPCCKIILAPSLYCLVPVCRKTTSMRRTSDCICRPGTENHRRDHPLLLQFGIICGGDLHCPGRHYLGQGLRPCRTYKRNIGMEDRIITYGGQAVIEGVLMRGQKAYAIAMRDPDGVIVLHEEKLANVYRSRITKIPFLRGIILLWDALGLGMRALTISANTQTGEDEKLEGWPLYLTIGVSLTLGIGLFFLLPAGVGSLAEHFLGWNVWWNNLLEGVFRLLLLVGYIWAIGFMPDIKRLFGYHGAEHKTINAYEAGAELTPESVAKFPLEHARCGTAFMLTLVLLSILVFTALGPLPVFWRLASRVLLIPLLAGVAVEYIRWTANHLDSKLVQWMIKPNLALQSLTTREPDLPCWRSPSIPSRVCVRQNRKS
jgi:uncharacterized protein YqhQ